jgi:hypothetical protein
MHRALSAVRETIGVTASSGSRRSHDDYARHAEDDDDIDMVRQHQQATVSCLRGSGASSAIISSARGSRERSAVAAVLPQNGNVVAMLRPILTRLITGSAAL